MKITNILMGIRLPLLIKLAFRKGISLRPVYFIRLIFLIPNSILSSVFGLVEKIKFSAKIKNTEITKPPVFIIGHWRTGTTFLQQLINLDCNFITPNVVQTAIPDHFIFSTPYYAPVMKAVMPSKRPMDEVAMAPFEPMEDEFALIRMGASSPVENLLFPRKNTFFMSDLQLFLPEGKMRDKWEKNLLWFIRKLVFYSSRQVVLKNPFHTPRIEILAKMFPGAKFIHICRNPYNVVPSTIRMWNIVAEENSLKPGWKKPAISDISHVMNFFLDKINNYTENTGKADFYEISFEKLENDTVAEIKKMYESLNFEFTADFNQKLSGFIQKHKDYRKNIYNLSPAEKDEIYRECKPWFDQYGYS